MTEPSTSCDKTILHIDMDAFFAAVEQLDNPELRGKPVVVGAPGNARGVVSTCSYEARKFGIHSAMPSRTAYKLCPQAIFVPVRGERYSEVSKKVFEIIEQYTPDVEKLSIDEAFLDVTASLRLFGSAEAIGEALKRQIYDEVGLTASVGLAPNKFLAKLASDLDKPNGMTIVPRQQADIEAFLAPLDIRRVWGIGEKSAQRFYERGVRCIGDLQKLSRVELRRLFGDKTAEHFYRLARGLDARDVTPVHREKSVSSEHTFSHDCSDWELVERQMRRQVEAVAARLRNKSLLARTAFIKVRWANFETITRQMQVRPATAADRPLLEAAAELLAAARQARSVRLIGFGVSLPSDTVDDTVWQPDLFSVSEDVENNEVDRRLDNAVDQVREQFGRDSIRRGF